LGCNTDSTALAASARIEPYAFVSPGRCSARTKSLQPSGPEAWARCIRHTIRLLTLAYTDSNDLKQARALLEEKKPLFAQNYIWREMWALLLALEGRPVEARQFIDEETERFVSGAFVVTLEGAEFHAVLGDR